MGTWVSFIFWLLSVTLLWTWVYKHLCESLLQIYIYLEVALLGGTVILFLICWRTTILFSLADAPVGSHLCTGFQVLCMLAKLVVFWFLFCFCFDLSHPNGNGVFWFLMDWERVGTEGERVKRQKGSNTRHKNGLISTGFQMSLKPFWNSPDTLSLTGKEGNVISWDRGCIGGSGHLTFVLKAPPMLDLGSLCTVLFSYFTSCVRRIIEYDSHLTSELRCYTRSRVFEISELKAF